MSTPNVFFKSNSYLALNLEPRSEVPSAYGRHAPAITVARQTGARGVAICTHLHQQLQQRDAKDPLPWTLFDGELSKKILQEHHLPEYLEKFIPDEAIGELQGTINELLGRHPSLWTLFKDTKETIARLASTGHCILVGHGSNHIAGHLHNVLSVRLIGSTAVRTRHVMDSLQINRAQAQALIKREDHARRSYVKQHFHCDIDDPASYDLVLRTDHWSDAGAAACIVKALEQLNPT